LDFIPQPGEIEVVDQRVLFRFVDLQSQPVALGHLAGAEGHGRQPFLVRQVRLRQLVPCKADGHRSFYFRRREHDRVAVDGRLGRHEIRPFANDFKPVERLAVTGDQAAAGVVERHAELAALQRERLEGRTAVDEPLAAVGLGQGDPRQPRAHVLLVPRVDVLEVADVVDNSHARIGNLQGLGLSLQKAGRMVGSLPYW
jgi:hypothetical protein